MGLPVGFVLELVGEVASSWAGWVGGVFVGEFPGAVDEMLWVDDGGWGDAVDDCAEFEEEVGFFGGLVGGHAAVFFLVIDVR